MNRHLRVLAAWSACLAMLAMVLTLAGAARAQAASEASAPDAGIPSQKEPMLSADEQAYVNDFHTHSAGPNLYRARNQLLAATCAAKNMSDMMWPANGLMLPNTPRP